MKTSEQTLARFGENMKSSKIASVVVLMAIVALFVGVQSVWAQTQTSACMNDVWNMAGKPGNLVCTAKEVYISENPDGSKIIEAAIVNDDGCLYPGDTATVDIVASLHFNTDRYDIGIYSSADGGNGYRGSCYVTYIPLTEGYPAPVWNFDGAGDLCADVNTAVGGNNLAGFTFQRMTLACQDLDNDGFLDFATCFSWRTSGNNGLCDAVGDLYPGTKSKCFCERVNINVPVPKASITVTKTASPTSVNEPGANVTFSVSIKNDGIDPTNIVYIDSLIDDVYGDLLDAKNPLVPYVTNTCLSLDTEMRGGETVACQFVAYVAGNGGDSQIDTVTASGQDSRTPANGVSGYDDATVTIVDVKPTISVTKTANPTSRVEPGGSVTFTVVVNNTSIADPLTITSLTDDMHGDLDGQGDCSLASPLTIPVGGSYSCWFKADVTGNAGYSETDTVTATGKDDEGNSVSASASATVNLTNVLSKISLVKTANPASVNEPGGKVTYSFTVRNDSSVDSVTITSLTDDVYGDLTAVDKTTCILPQTIARGGSYSCQITMYVAGDPGGGEGQGYDFVRNVATAKGVDDDGDLVSANDDALVNIVNVPPAAHLTKTVTQMSVTYKVVVYNDSPAEILYLDKLFDDQFGDLDGIGTCVAAGQEIAVGGTYSCEFTADVESSPHTDTVTATVADNEENTVAPPPSGSATVTFGSP